MTQDTLWAGKVGVLMPQIHPPSLIPAIHSTQTHLPHAHAQPSWHMCYGIRAQRMVWATLHCSRAGRGIDKSPRTHSPLDLFHVAPLRLAHHWLQAHNPVFAPLHTLQGSTRFNVAPYKGACKGCTKPILA